MLLDFSLRLLKTSPRTKKKRISSTWKSENLPKLAVTLLYSRCFLFFSFGKPHARFSHAFPPSLHMLGSAQEEDDWSVSTVSSVCYCKCALGACGACGACVCVSPMEMPLLEGGEAERRHRRRKESLLFNSGAGVMRLHCV